MDFVVRSGKYLNFLLIKVDKTVDKTKFWGFFEAKEVPFLLMLQPTKSECQDSLICVCFEWVSNENKVK